jgi:hypothetical protein
MIGIAIAWRTMAFASTFLQVQVQPAAQQAWPQAKQTFAGSRWYFNT